MPSLHRHRWEATIEPVVAERCAPLLATLTRIARLDYTLTRWASRIADDALLAHREREEKSDDTSTRDRRPVHNQEALLAPAALESIAQEGLMINRADEVEVLADELESYMFYPPVKRSAAALREYTALLREDRCAPLVEAIEAYLREGRTQWTEEGFRAALCAHHERKGGEHGE